MNLIKRIIVFFLCLQVAVPQHLQGDILRLPVLIGHFLHHNDHHKSIDFTDFLVEHYADTEQHDTDHEEHEQLPFHHHSDDCTTQQIQLAFFSVKDFCIQPFSRQSSIIISIYKQTYFPSNSFVSVWRPPKFS